MTDPCDNWPVPLECFLNKAKSLGFKGDQLPWFGLFIEVSNNIMIITPYKSSGSVDIAIDRMSKRGTSGKIWFYGDDEACAGFIAAEK